MDYTIHGILQARILEWVAFSFSRGSSQSRNWTRVSCTAGIFFANWPIGEAHNKLRREHKITGPDTLLREDLCHILGSTYKWYHMLWLTSFSMIISRPIHILSNGITSFFFLWLCNAYIYTPHLIYSFICQWPFKLLPCHGYCKWCPYWQIGLHETF